MSGVALAGSLGCVRIYDPIAPADFDLIYRVDETVCGRLLRGGTLHLACQGTESRPGWMADGDITPHRHPVLGTLHSGFWCNIPALIDQLEPYLQELLNVMPDLAIEVEGHSKGAGEGVLLAAELKVLGYRLGKTYLFACPNAGYQDFADWCRLNLDAVSYRNAPDDGLEGELLGDPVPLLPVSPFIPPVPHTLITVSPPGLERCLSAEWHSGTLYNEWASTQV